MFVEQVWTGNAYRDFNYLVVCPETGDALANDPLDYRKCLAAATDASIVAHENAANGIPSMSRGVSAGDILKVGNTVEMECLDTPRHTIHALVTTLAQQRDINPFFRLQIPPVIARLQGSFPDLALPLQPRTFS